MLLAALMTFELPLQGCATVPNRPRRDVRRLDLTAPKLPVGSTQATGETQPISMRPLVACAHFSDGGLPHRRLCIGESLKVKTVGWHRASLSPAAHRRQLKQSVFWSTVEARLSIINTGFAIAVIAEFVNPVATPEINCWAFLRRSPRTPPMGVMSHVDTLGT